MTETEKTVYFGSFFELTSAGRDELIRGYQANFSSYDAPPFISFDSKRNLFYCKTNNPDSTALFITKFKCFLEFHMKIHADVIGSPRILPIRNTVHPGELIDQDIHKFVLSGDRLIEYDEDSDDSSEATKGPVPTAYWNPKSGDISILTSDIAAAIADLTDCFLSPDPEGKRVKLISGNVQLALEKLSRLEPLMEFQTLYRGGAASKIKHNIHFPTSPTPGTGTVFVPTMLPPHSDRIMVETCLEDKVGSMVIAEQRNWDNSKGKYTKPANLSLIDVKETAAFNLSRIWVNQRISSIGNAKNMEPVKSASSKLGNGTDAQEKAVAKAIQNSKYLKAHDQARVSEWSQNVDFRANPEIVAPEPVDAETEILEFSQAQLRKSRTHRIIVEDSDSETEINERLAATVKRTHLGESSSDGQPKMVRTTKQFQAAGDQLPISYTPKEPNQTRLSRARRPQFSSQPAYRDEVISHPTEFSDHATFYAGVPRDELTQGPMPLKKIGHSGSSHGFGLDGTDETTNHLGMKTDSYASVSKPEDKPQDFESPSDTSRTFSIPINYSNKSNQGPSTAVQIPSYEVSRRQIKKNSARYRTKNRSLAENVTANHQVESNLSQSSIASGVRQTTEHQRDLLIDIEEEDNANTPMQAPPGFDYRAAPLTYVPTAETILDAPVPNLEESVTSYSSDVGPTDVPGRDSLEQKPASQNWKPQLSIPKRDLEYLRNQTINKLIADQTRKERQMGRDENAKASKSCERLETSDESMTRQFHKTMTLQTPNPGKSKNLSTNQKATVVPKGETKRECTERIANAMAEAFKPISTSGASSSRPNPASSSEPVTISAPARKAMKSNSLMAALHSNLALSEYRKQQSIKLLKALQEEFESARAFSGSVTFEVQLGQVLIAENARIKDSTVYESHQWDKLFGSRQDTVSSMFSNMLTSNGADVDRLLEIRDPNSKTKVWSPKSPGPSDVLYEFCCQDQTGLSFKVTLDSKGKDTITKHPISIGKVALHFPGQVWDACATLYGVSNWHDIPIPVVKAAQYLVSEMYISSDDSSTVFYRLPASNIFTIHNVTIRRLSFHDAMSSEWQDFQLRIFEVKALYTETHHEDQKLYRSFERSYHRMIDEGRIHYEAAVIHKGINKAFKVNRNLELGELTPAATTGKSLLSRDAIRTMLDLTAMTVERMDWMGMDNYGTINRKADEAARRYEHLSNAIPPTAHNSIPGRQLHIPVGYNSLGTGSSVKGGSFSGHDGGMTRLSGAPIPGVRAGTQAEIFRDMDGNYYRYGQGGARIPVVMADNTNTTIRGDVVPGDSASQIGGSRTVLQRTMQNARNDIESKPPGFW